MCHVIDARLKRLLQRKLAEILRMLPIDSHKLLHKSADKCFTEIETLINIVQIKTAAKLCFLFHFVKAQDLLLFPKFGR